MKKAKRKHLKCFVSGMWQKMNTFSHLLVKFSCSIESPNHQRCKIGVISIRLSCWELLEPGTGIFSLNVFPEPSFPPLIPPLHQKLLNLREVRKRGKISIERLKVKSCSMFALCRMHKCCEVKAVSYTIFDSKLKLLPSLLKVASGHLKISKNWKQHFQ